VSSTIEWWLVAFILFLSGFASATETLRQEQWVVEGIERTALIAVPVGTTTHTGLPLVFAFHGHGGSSKQAARSLRIHEEWPEAIVVYPQGLKTPGRLTDPEGKRSGWQHGPGDQEDRDLKFFDAMLENLYKIYDVDKKRVYSTGHSNGGAFTYLLWALRGDTFAAFAPSGAAAPRPKLRLFKPKPVLHVAGRQDTLVKFDWQEATMKALRRLNQCGEGEPWGEKEWCTLYTSEVGAPVVTCIYPRGHKFPAEAPAIIVKFLKEQGSP